MSNPSPTPERVVVRFAGDSGDGMQLAGSQFTRTTALAGNDLATLPDFPAEIRAPAGTRGGVSGFQIQFASKHIHTPGDEADALVAMNAAALVTNLTSIKKGGLVIVNSDKFGRIDLGKAELETNPLEDGSLSDFVAFQVPISSMTREAVEPFGLNRKHADRCKNFFALGIVYWLYGRSLETTEAWIQKKFQAPFLEANLAALRAGHAFAETAEMAEHQRIVGAADFETGEYRNITGNMGLALGLTAAATNSGRDVFYGTYPITPASDILHALARFKNYGVLTFQAEDEIAAVCAAIGASYAGAIGTTGTSGPGLALKAEAIGLAVMAELPLIVINVQRAGPSTGMPTKTEQADLLQTMFGRNGESPCAVISASRPNDTFEVAYEAARLAVKYMTPVVVLSDGYIANGAEPWSIPDVGSLPAIEFPPAPTDPEGFLPYQRDEATLARPWVVPGTPGFEHRIGGLEKEDLTGNVSYDPQNHEHMTIVREEKLKRLQSALPEVTPFGSDKGTLIVGWGSTYGAIRTVTERLLSEGHDVAHLHLRHIHPFAPNLGEVLGRYDKVLVPELNRGQLTMLLRHTFLVDAECVSKIQGQPFRTTELHERILSHMSSTEVR